MNIKWHANIQISHAVCFVYYIFVFVLSCKLVQTEAPVLQVKLSYQRAIN